MTARQYLSRAYNLRRRIAAKELHLAELRTQAEHITADLTGMPKGSGASSPVERVAVQIADLSWELEQDWLDVLAYQEEIRRTIDLVEDPVVAQVLSARNAGVRTQKVLDADEDWYGEPYADPAGADTERETAADPSMLPRFSLPGLSDRFTGSLDAGPLNTGLTTAAYNMAGRGIIELWDKGDDANRQKARDQLAAVWPSLSEEQKRNMRSVLGLHGMEISA